MSNAFIKSRSWIINSSKYAKVLFVQLASNFESLFHEKVEKIICTHSAVTENGADTYVTCELSNSRFSIYLFIYLSIYKFGLGSTASTWILLDQQNPTGDDSAEGANGRPLDLVLL